MYMGKLERQKLLGQKGCVIWITGLSGSGKSTLACALSRELYCRGHLSYVLDGDNVRHGMNKDLIFKPEDRSENIRRIGNLISPYKQDRDACHALLRENAFIEVISSLQMFLHIAFLNPDDFTWDKARSQHSNAK
ncbi:hypothetical protein Taro_006299, partial [Colocasia esculenta]|nr:hypothetical protein [Colocasia esculenta]